MIPTVLAEKWLGLFTEKTFFNKIKWSGSKTLESTYNGYTCELSSGPDGELYWNIVQYVSSFGFRINLFQKKITIGEPLYAKAQELYELAGMSAEKTENNTCLNAYTDFDANISV